jgi:sulfide dehydrogenase [flavocytochrome c] flavoprotein chain
MSQFNRPRLPQGRHRRGSRRAFLLVPKAAHAGKKASIVVIGGGFGGATAAKYLKLMDPASMSPWSNAKTYTSCPLSNEVISGHGKIEDCKSATTA